MRVYGLAGSCVLLLLGAAACKRAPATPPNVVRAAGGDITITPFMHASVQIEHAGSGIARRVGLLGLHPGGGPSLGRDKRLTFTLLATVCGMSHGYEAAWRGTLGASGFSSGASLAFRIRLKLPLAPFTAPAIARPRRAPFDGVAA